MNNDISKYLIWYPAFWMRRQKVWTAKDTYIKSQYTDQEQIRASQLNDFKKIVSFAYNNIQFYNTKYKNAKVHPDDINSFDDIKKIPLLTKQELLNDSKTIYNKKYYGKKFRRATSGSTGIPFAFYKDSLSMTIMDAILYRNYSWMGIDIGYRQARYWGHPIKKTELCKTKLQDRLLNRIRLSPFLLEDKAHELHLKKIKSFNAQYMYGYAQSIFHFCNYFYKKKTDLSFLKFNAVILTGEMISSNQINIIQKVFGCDVTEEYGCTEVGIIGFRCKHGNMHLMENLLVEVDNDLIGAGSGNIITSELYGKLFPFIRYQVGDRGAIVNKRCPCGRKLPILDNLSGRKDDFIICSTDKMVDPYLLEYIINEIPHRYGSVVQFRIIQKKIDYIQVFLVGDGDLDKIGTFIKNEFINNLSEDMNIEINFVSFIEKEPSGKLRCFISEIA